MEQAEFIDKRSADWRRLEALLATAGRAVDRLSEADLADLGYLYRTATSDLALAQRDYPGEQVAVYLNQLVARAHGVIYQSEPLRGRQLLLFYTRTFPAIYRKLWPYTLAASLLFALPAIAAFLVVWRQPDAIYVILGPGIRELVETVKSGRLWTDIAPAVRPMASSTILTNNIQVMFLAFAGGMTGGLLTVYVMLFNGLDLGAVFGLLQAHGMVSGLAMFVSAHGFIELSVIFLAGGCGLYIGDALLRPGLHSRRRALQQHSLLAVQAIFGCIPLLVLAGLIEGFISPSGLPWWAKLAIGAATGLALYTYWLCLPRTAAVQRSSTGRGGAS